ncbi:MAG TPA: class I SAM-dependent methyltransferase [Terriglobales bacterium]|nr:class I SAM-dependent methyltransferase [Terriglobales bacterium]
MSSSFNPSEYWEERLRTNPGITGVGYTSLGTGYNYWLYRVRRKVFLRVLRARGIDWSKATVLDIGSGTGFYIELWKELGASAIVGSDITEIATSDLRARFPEQTFLRLDIGAELPNSLTNSFDAVSAFDVFFHIVDDSRYRAALENIRNALRPGGWFFFSDIALHGPTQRSIHMVSRALCEIEDLLQRVGFHTIDRIPMFVLLNQPLDTNSTFHPFLWQLFVHAVRICKPIGYLSGAIVYPLELMLTALCRESRTTEILICRKS